MFSVFVTIPWPSSIMTYRANNNQRNDNEKKNSFKGAVSGLRKFLTTESSLKMMGNTFYYTLKAFSVLKIFKFLP